MLPAEFGHGCAGLGLLEYGNDLTVGKTRFLQGNLIGLDYEKIPLLAATDLWGDYPGPFDLLAATRATAEVF